MQIGSRRKPNAPPTPTGVCERMIEQIFEMGVCGNVPVLYYSSLCRLDHPWTAPSSERKPEQERIRSTYLQHIIFWYYAKKVLISNPGPNFNLLLNYY